MEVHQLRPHGLERLNRGLAVLDQRLGVELHLQGRTRHRLDDGEALQRRVDEIGIVRSQRLEAEAGAVILDAPRQFVHEGDRLGARRGGGNRTALAAAAPDQRAAAEIAAHLRQMRQEIQALGALGRRLITTDALNRQGTTNSSVAAGRPNTTYNTDFLYRAGQGVSNYNALTALTNYRTRRGFLQLAYTWAHTIDNQSEPLAGDFFNLFFVSANAGGGGSLNRAAFSEQFNSSGDRANADFDQRHNLVVLSDWEIPSLFASSRAAAVFRNWRFAQIAAFRTGFPYSVIANAGVIPGSGVIANGRPDLLDADAATVDQAAPELGGRILLNPAAFVRAPNNRVGTSGRNSFRGPGLFNVDIAVSRSFRPGWMGEAARMTFRADVFNVLNHANLNNPDSLLSSPTFGLARFGRRGADTGFPALQPFNETARQFQLILRLEF